MPHITRVVPECAVSDETDRPDDVTLSLCLEDCVGVNLTIPPGAALARSGFKRAYPG